MALDFSKRFMRLWRHWRCSTGDIKRYFGVDGFAQIEAAIAKGEVAHSAEVRFAVEASLDAYQIWTQVSPRQRAHTHFSGLRVWDTEGNNGVLIYLLLGDRSVEIVVDREAQRRISPQVWTSACAVMSEAFSKSQYTQGVLRALDIIQPSLVVAFPLQVGDRNELSNEVGVQ
jgi:uncharacterized membrane protein